MVLRPADRRQIVRLRPVGPRFRCVHVLFIWSVLIGVHLWLPTSVLIPFFEVACVTELWIAIVLGVIEGITEFLPISSTGHLLLAKHWLAGVADLRSDFWSRFVVFIQIGAILAVVVFFRGRIRHLLTGGRGSERAPALEPTAKQSALITPSCRAS